MALGSIRIIAPSRDFKYQAKHPLEIAEMLGRHHYHVEVVSPSSPDLARLLEHNSYKLARSPRVVSRVVPRFAGPESMMLALLRGLPRTDIVIGVDPPGLLVAHLLWKLGRASRLVYYALEVCLPEESSQWTTLYQRSCIQDVDLVVTTGEHRGQLLAERFDLRQNPVVVHNSFITRSGQGPSVLRKMLMDRGIAATEHLVIYGGGLSEENCVPEIVRSVADWPESASLVLFGFGEAQFIRNVLDEARALGVSNRVHYLGTLPPGHSKVLNVVSGATAGLVLKKYRGRSWNDVLYTPTKLIEYAAVGLPVVCSDQDTLRFVESEGWGICVDPGSSAHIAKAVASIVANESGQRSMAENARQAFKDRYCMERQVEPLLAAITGLLG